MEGLLDNLDYIERFENRIEDREHFLTEESLNTMQLNIGYICNLACKHCHVGGGPNRQETMSLEVMRDCLEVFEKNKFTTLDITGGAPEINENFMWLVENGVKIASKVIVRTNLVILTEEKYKHLPEFYAKNKVEIVCSLPYYSEADTDRQRGNGVFEKSIEALKTLNSLGYGKEKDLVLNLVYNPGGAFLPPSQDSMTSEYRIKLYKNYGIEFNSLFTITNNPVGRFALFLERSGNLEGYMKKLSNSFNPSTLSSMMCRSQISVDYNGDIYDCDFNQVIGALSNGSNNIRDLVGKSIERRRICFGNHCYACTAGAGSSCTGTTA